MQSILKPLGVAVVALTATVSSLAAPASAGSRGDVAAGVVGGLIVGGIVGSAAANARPAPPPAYYAAPAAHGCGDLRRRAEYNESIGRYDRADYWRAQFRACRHDR